MPIRPSLFAFLLATALAPAAALAQGSPAPSTTDAEIEATVANRTRMRLQILFLAPADATGWGEDRLGSDTVAAGRRYSVRLEAGQCSYDVRAIYQNGREETRFGLNLCETPEVALQGTGAAEVPARAGVALYRVQNRAETRIYAFHVAPAGSGERGEDVLGNSVLERGNTFTGRASREGDCRYDLVAVYEDANGEEESRPGVNLCETRELTFAGPSNDPALVAQLGIVNRARQALQVLNIRPAGASSWGPDRFGPNVVPPGQTFPLRFRRAGGGCSFDVQMTYADGATEERLAQDLCRTAELVFTGPPQTARGRGVQKTPAGQQPAAAQQEFSAIRVVNHSELAIEAVHMTSSRVSDWGENLLPQGTVAPGAEFAFRVQRDGQCDFDLRVTYAGGREERRMRQNVCGELTSFAFRGPDVRVVDGGGPDGGRMVTVLNEGPIELMELYMTSTQDTHWGDDRLGASTLPRRWRLEFRVPNEDGCRFDVRAVFRGGASVEQRDQDVCADGTVRLERRFTSGALVATGTGFFVSSAGHLVTNQHVVDGCGAVAIARPNGERVMLRRIAEDERGDLALLQQEGAVMPHPLTLRTANPPVRPGERVIVVGYPIRQELGGVNVAEGLVSAARGPRGDERRFQYSAPTQAGNSGGPVFDESGLVIGVVVSQLGNFGERAAQNVNFGIRLDELQRFLRANGVSTEEAPPTEMRRPYEILERMGDAVVPLDCLG